jgi:hypothetical protein
MAPNMSEPQVVSASRRTDIPAYYTEWLLGRLKAGRCRYFHVFSRQWHEVDLRREAVRAMVLWSKNYAPLLPYLDTIAGHAPFICQFTITGHPADLEPCAPPWREAVAQAREIASRFSAGHVMWRFDPIVITQRTPRAEVVERFTRLIDALAGHTRVCAYSFVQEYRKVNARLRELGVTFDELPLEDQHDLAHELSAIAAQRGIELRACCIPAPPGGAIPQARCIDRDALIAAGMDPQPALKRAATRKGCGCYKSVDIGAYDTCPSGCVFCYANRGLTKARAYAEEHDPATDTLG